MASSTDRILLVTLTPPGTGNVGEIILKDLCALLPAGTVHVCVVAPRTPSVLLSAGAFTFLEASPDARQSGLPGRLGGFVNAIHVRHCSPSARAAWRVPLRRRRRQGSLISRFSEGAQAVYFWFRRRGGLWRLPQVIIQSLPTWAFLKHKQRAPYLMHLHDHLLAVYRREA
jgi:hypothetical protein